MSLKASLRPLLQFPRVWAYPPKSRLLSSIPDVHANELAVSQNLLHVQQVDHHLQARGILKINLQFPDDNSIYLERLIRQLHQSQGHGLPITHSASRGWFWDVRPQADIPTTNATARSETMNQFPWHTDCSYEASPPRFFALQVLQPDRCGGGTLSVLDCTQLVSRLSSPVRAALAQSEFRIAVPPEFTKDEQQTSIIGPVLCAEEDDRAQLRFRSDIISPLTLRAEKAFRELQDLLSHADTEGDVMHLTPQMLPRGSIVLIDNRRWLHARNHVRDPARHLRRVRWDARPFGASI